MAVARVTEVIASSPIGWKEAVDEALDRANQTLRNITGIEVINQRAKISDGKIIGIVQAVLRETLDEDGVSSSGFSCLAGRANALTECLGLVQQ